MQRVFVGCIILFAISCSKVDDGFLGEWEGTINQINTMGIVVDVATSCEIKSLSGNERSVRLSVGGKTFDFEAEEGLDILNYKDYPLNSDSTIIRYISGKVELVGDSVLHFDHQLYALKNGAVLNSERQRMEMKRK